MRTKTSAVKPLIAAAAARKYRPIQSAVPGTTLGPIQIDAFLGGGVLSFVLHYMFSGLFLLNNVGISCLKTVIVCLMSGFS